MNFARYLIKLFQIIHRAIHCLQIIYIWYMQTIQGFLEKDLIFQLRNGDRSSFEILFHFYYPGLVVYSSQFTTDHMESEEIVQDFFVKLWQIHPEIQLTDSLKGFIFSSVKNSCFNYLKHKKIKQKYIAALGKLSENHLVYDPDLYIVSELQLKIKRAIDHLPDKCREVFKMSRIHGMKNEKIASELNISKRTVETHISNAIKHLREELKDYLSLLILLGFFDN